VAQVKDSSGALVYHNFKEEGKGSDDFQKFVADQIPKLQLALIVDAMRSAGGEIKNVANGLVGTADDLTQALDGMDTTAVNDMAAGLSSLTGVLKTLKAISGSEVFGTAAVELAKLSGGAHNFAATLTSYIDSVLTDRKPMNQLPQEILIPTVLLTNANASRLGANADRNIELVIQAAPVSESVLSVSTLFHTHLLTWRKSWP
jgi:hypothetical protein